jgi:hypothetical protein
MMQRSFYRFAAGALCFTAVLVAWVFFRAETFAGAWNMLQSMSRLADIGSTAPQALNKVPLLSLPVLAIAMLVAWLLPNLQEWMAAERLVLTARKITPPRIAWSRTWWWGVAAALPASIAMYKLIYMSNRITEFIYFQF